MAHTLTITVDDALYETLKPFIEQQTISAFLSTVIAKNLSLIKTPHNGIESFRGSLHQVDTSDIREKDDRAI